MLEQKNQTLALAATLQALQGVVSVARRGRVEPIVVQGVLAGVLTPVKADYEALYGGTLRLHIGLQALVEQFEQPRDMELTRYLITVLQLERRVSRDPQRLSALGSGLTHARRQAEYFDSLDAPSVIQYLAGLYSEQVSTARPKVIVQGAREFLEQPSNATMIRALLLAAVRGTSLWRAAGGRRWQLLFRRQALRECAADLLGP